ncbi:MAG: menaquinone biosynthesis protein [Acidobacteriota bacterium]|nr:menaquinone biosynthesis protein [Acidobacteriota bacterium]
MRVRKLKLAIVCYANSLPLSWGFMQNRPKDRFELEFSPPALCADKIAAGSVDIGLIPAIAYQRIPDLRIIPNLSVASKGSVRSVLLVSKVPWSRIRSVALDRSSRTSVILLRILLRMRNQLDPTFYSHEPELASMLRRHDAALLIGDAALTADTASLYRYDLAEAWLEETGKPFVFAFWACRAESGLEDSSPFEESYRYGKAHLDDIVRRQSCQLRIPTEQIRSYLTRYIDYSLDEENLDGLLHFYRLAREMNLIAETKPLQFVR